MKKRIVKEAISWVLVIVVALGLAFVINKLFLMSVTPESASMENTIMVGDRVWTFPLAYKFGDPQRGDIVYFNPPFYSEKGYIKRIMGLPGEMIEGKAEDGLVYIDGVPLEEDYVTEMISEDFGPFTVPEDSYFMMGDNRGISYDSRDWEVKFVKRDLIISKAILKYPDFKWLY